MKNIRSSNIYFIIFLFSQAFLFSEELKDPSWVYLKRASNFIEKKDFANALSEVKKSRLRKINEDLDAYWEKINLDFPEKTRYELKKMMKEKEALLKVEGGFPQYHYIVADIYANTDFLDEAEKEYRVALSQSENLDYPDQILEIQYKLALLYNKKGNLYLEQMTYHEILKGFFSQKNNEYWERIRYNIREDMSLNYVFKIYRIEGIKYLKALYQLGVHEALLQKQNESLFYLNLATIVWMTYYGTEIKKFVPEFQYEGPVDFINYIKNNRFSKHVNDDFIIDKLMFYIGYNLFINREYQIASHYFKLSLIYAESTGRLVMIRDQINYLENNKDHVLTYEEIL